MLIGTYLDLQTNESHSVCVRCYEDFIRYLKGKGKNFLMITADPEVPYFINAVVEDIDPDLEDDAYVVFSVRG